MKPSRWLAALLLILFNAISVHAQNTNVSATVTDSNSVVWANGKYTFNFIPNPRFQSGPYFNNGVSFTPVSISGNLDGTGSLTSVAVPSNSTITPSGTQWTITYCPQATASCQTSNPITVTGASQNITSSFTPNALTIAPGPGVLVYNTNEVPVASLGAQVFLIGTGQQFCTAVSGSTCSIWSAGGGIAQGAAPQMGVYLGPLCPVGNTASCFFSAANTQQVNDCTVTSGTTALSCNSAHFFPTDTGKRYNGYQTCTASVNLAANSNNAPITTGIQTLTYVSATAVTLSANAANTLTLSTIFPLGGCFIFGTPDDAGASALDTAIASLTNCTVIHLFAGNYWFNGPHFTVSPIGCNNQPSLGGLVGASQNDGNIVYNAGLEVTGRGSGPTSIFLPNDFPESPFTCTNGKSTHGCWVVTTEGRWSDLQISGGGNRIANGMTGSAGPPEFPILLEMDGPAQLQNFVGVNFGQRAPSGQVITGVGAYNWSQLNHVNLSAFGSAMLNTNVSSSVTAIQLWVENIADYEGIGLGALSDYLVFSVPSFSKYNFICYDCTVGQESTATGSPGFFLVNRGGMKVKWYRGGLSTEVGPTVNGNVGYDCVTTAGCVFDVQDASLDFSIPAGDQNNIAINCTVACTNIIENSVIKGSATGGKAYNDVVGSTFVNRCLNTFGGGVASSFNGTAYALPCEGGTVSCATSAATITFKGTYVLNPAVTIQDQTTAGVVTQTSLSNTSKVVGCPGASDVLNFTVTPNPI